MGAILKGQDLEQGAMGMQGTCSCLLPGRAAGLQAALALPAALPIRCAEFFLEASMLEARGGLSGLCMQRQNCALM